MIEVSLTVDEAALAIHVATMRQLESMRQGRCNRHGAVGASVIASLSRHVQGAGGELAVARCLDRYYAGTVNGGKGEDVGALQVRTRTEHDWDLIVRHDDCDDDRFVLVTGAMPAYVARGWIVGGDAKRSEWLGDHGGHGEAFFVPQPALSAIEILGPRSAVGAEREAAGPGLVRQANDWGRHGWTRLRPPENGQSPTDHEPESERA